MSRSSQQELFSKEDLQHIREEIFGDEKALVQARALKDFFHEILETEEGLKHPSTISFQKYGAISYWLRFIAENCEKYSLLNCEHKNIEQPYELRENCKDCGAKRTRTKNEPSIGFSPLYSEWSSWKF